MTLLTFGLLASPINCFADSDKTAAIGINGGSRGLGFDFVYRVNDSFNLRGSLSSYNFDEDFDEDGINYSGEFDLDTKGLMLDYYPFSGSFRLTAGYFSNGTSLGARAEPGNDGTVNINGFDYDVSGEWVQSDMDWDSSAPYFGLGWGNSLGEGSNWTFTFDIGVLLTGEPRAALTASAGLHADAATLGRNLDADLAAEEAELNDDLSDFNKYPVLQIGLTYAF